MTTKQEQLQELFHRYQREHDGIPETPYTVVHWALSHGYIDPPKLDPAAALAEDMARALREEHATDPITGRRYRRNHAVRVTSHGVQGSLWAEMDSAPRTHMVKAFKQRRNQIVDDCVQLKVDVDVYNSKHADEPLVQMPLDFSDDVSEIEAANEVLKAKAATRAARKLTGAGAGKMKSSDRANDRSPS